MSRESTRTFRHTPFKLDEHIERLFLSMKLTRIDPRMSVAEMKAITLRVLEANLGNYATREDCRIVHNSSRGLSVAGADPTMNLPPTLRRVVHGMAPLNDHAKTGNIDS